MPDTQNKYKYDFYPDMCENPISAPKPFRLSPRSVEPLTVFDQVI